MAHTGIRKIGITGGIAAGKSCVAEMLAQALGCQHIDADVVCRRLLEPEAEGWQELARAIGSGYFLPDSTINRLLLRQQLFADEAFRDTVNRVVHPLVKREIVAAMDRIIGSAANSRVLVEVPLLYEVHWEDLFDTVIVVYADYEKCLARLAARDGVSRAEAQIALESQLPLAEKVLRGDHVIDNSGMLSDTHTRVEHLAALLQNNGSGTEKKLDSKK
jgi:dephospho-CoA kinase